MQRRQDFPDRAETSGPVQAASGEHADSATLKPRGRAIAVELDLKQTLITVGGWSTSVTNCGAMKSGAGARAMGSAGMARDCSAKPVSLRWLE